MPLTRWGCVEPACSRLVDDFGAALSEEDGAVSLYTDGRAPWYAGAFITDFSQKGRLTKIRDGATPAALWRHFPFMAMAGAVDKFLLILAAVAVAWVLLAILKIIAAVSLWALAVILKGAVIVLAVAAILIVLWRRRDRQPLNYLFRFSCHSARAQWRPVTPTP